MASGLLQSWSSTRLNLIALLVCWAVASNGQIIDPANWRVLHYGNPSVKILEQEVAWLISDTSNQTANMNDIFVKLLKRQLSKPYVSGALDKVNVNLKPIFSWHEVDCYTLVENTLALINAYRYETGYNDSAIAQSFNQTVSERICQRFFTELASIRYRSGAYAGYNSRLHFARDLISENSRNGWFIPDLPVKWDTISRKISISKKVLGLSKQDLFRLKQTEDSLSELAFRYISVAAADSGLLHLKSGTLLFFLASPKKLIDISHVGVLVHENGIPKILHASSTSRKVVVSQHSVVTYMKKVGCPGFIPVWTLSE